MKGLLLKDFLALRKYSKTILVIIVFYIFFGFFNNNPNFSAGMTVMLFAIMTITSFSYDDLAKWDKYARSLPVTKKEIVMSKYLLALILSLMGVVLSVLFSLLFSLIKGGTNMLESLLTTYALFAIAILFLSILLPLIYRFGSEKSRLMMFAVFLIPAGIVVALVKMNVPMPTEDQMMLLLKLSPILLVLFSTISFLVSCRIYRNKEL